MSIPGAVLAGLVAILGGTFTIIASYAMGQIFRVVRDAAEAEDEQPETTATRVRRLTRALQESAEAIDDIQDEIQERQRVAERLQKDVQTYERLREMNREEVEAVVQVLGGVVKSEGRRSLWRDIALFVAGVAVSVITTLLLG